MIRQVKLVSHTHIWDIDGINVTLIRKSGITTEQYCEIIETFQLLLAEELYHQDATIVRDIFSRIGPISFFSLGIEAFHDRFLAMCRWYCKMYLQTWYENNAQKALGLEPSFKHVLAVMLGNKQCFHLQSMQDAGYRCILINIMHDEFIKFCEKKILAALEACEGLDGIRTKISLNLLIPFCMNVAPHLTEEYTAREAKGFTQRREMITRGALLDKIFGHGAQKEKCDKDGPFYSMLCTIVSREADIQSTKFINENYLAMNVQKDIWRIYFYRNNTLVFRSMDFTQITSASLRTEVKYFMMFRLSHKLNAGFRAAINLMHALNILTNNNPNIKYTADILDTDVSALYLYMETEYIGSYRKKLGIATIADIFASCSLFVSYLMGNMRNPEIKSPRPHKNPFADVKFVNVKNYCKNTEIIPESVMEKLDEHIEEIPEHFALMYKIFSNTGMRAKEVLLLEAECVEPSMYDNLFLIRYTPYKVLAARRKAGVGDYHRALISSELAGDIQTWANQTEDLRKKSGRSYLFLSLRYGERGSLLNLYYFNKAINGLLEKHNICGDEGVPWHFTSMQCRKTLAVTLIENGATTEELSYFLGHLCFSTSIKYYAEVRKMKLAKLNTDFFKKQFELCISAEQLEQFNEEERKLLYIDFRLERRRVEFGFCLRSPGMGKCDRRSNLYGCVNCRHLCTGIQYLVYWQELLQEQERYLSELKSSYQNAGITQYNEFREYQQVLLLRDGYLSVVNSILESR